MGKANEQLRAEAVERLRGLGEHVQASSIQWALFGAGRANMPPDELRDALIYLLADEQDADAQIDDAVAIMRKAAKGYPGDTGDVMENLKLMLDMPEGACGYVTICSLADMVERDYVRKDAITQDVCDKWMDAKDAEVAKLTAERDKWKSEYNELNYKIGKITEEGSELMTKQPYTFDVNDVPGALRTVGRYIDELKSAIDMDSRIRESQDSAIEEIARQRDEWKRKAEGSSKVRVGQSNLEWLFEHDYETLCDQMGGQPCSCCVVGCKEDLGSDEACAKALREWLMAPHMDARQDNDGTCPDDDETASNHSKNALTLSDLYGIWSDESCRQYTDQGEREEAHDGESDSREKLESDIQSDLAALSEYGKLMLDWHVVMDWLDRQAAITEREHPGFTISDDESLINWRGKNYLPQSRALNAERERNEFSLKLKHEMELNRDNRNALDLERISELQAKVDELTAERDHMQRRIAVLSGEVKRQWKVIKTQEESLRKIEAEGCSCPEVIEHLENGITYGVSVDGIEYVRETGRMRDLVEENRKLHRELSRLNEQVRGTRQLPKKCKWPRKDGKLVKIGPTQAREVAFDRTGGWIRWSDSEKETTRFKYGEEL